MRQTGKSLETPKDLRAEGLRRRQPPPPPFRAACGRACTGDLRSRQDNLPRRPCTRCAEMGWLRLLQRGALHVLWRRWVWLRESSGFPMSLTRGWVRKLVVAALILSSWWCRLPHSSALVPENVAAQLLRVQGSHSPEGGCIPIVLGRQCPPASCPILLLGKEGKEPSFPNTRVAWMVVRSQRALLGNLPSDTSTQGHESYHSVLPAFVLGMKKRRGGGEWTQRAWRLQGNLPSSRQFGFAAGRGEYSSKDLLGIMPPPPPPESGSDQRGIFSQVTL